MPEHILAIDQGTTSTRSIVFDAAARPVGSARQELRQIFPRPGWVEHDPNEILSAVVETARQAVRSAGLGWADIAAIGIANQRETTVVWERSTGRPVANAIVWQCRRTAPMCEGLKARGLEPEIRARTGLVIDAYFSATKLRWLLDHAPKGQDRAEAGELCFGTVDSWLLYRLTGGAIHATDATNASRTMLVNLRDLDWDDTLLDLFQVPRRLLPEVKPSAAEFAETSRDVLGGEVLVAGIAGDQHASLYGQACFKSGMAKCTYGTGAFVLANAGSRVPATSGGVLGTLGWQTGGKIVYALEGSIFVTGAAIQWLRDNMLVISSAEETASLAELADTNGGVYFVPALVGLGAPHWDPEARGAIVGLTRGASYAHVVRAALESTAYQVKDVLDAMAVVGRSQGSQQALTLRADGGQTANEFLMQFQADILGRLVEVASVQETTALGAAFLAGRAIGLWKSDTELSKSWSASRVYEPRMSVTERLELHQGWKQALAQARYRGE
ncbi:MAG: glycerol kinase GlpK [Chloroflexi bacterium]|nr:glycerol kinase GlpK [Chloroflexota bacterium]